MFSYTLLNLLIIFKDYYSENHFRVDSGKSCYRSEGPSTLVQVKKQSVTCREMDCSVDTMPLDNFPLLQDNTRLIRFKDTLYKVKVKYDAESFKKNTLSFNESEAHEEIEQTFRAVLYLSDRNQVLKPICTRDFLIKPLKIPWSFPKKNSNCVFKQHGKLLEVFDYMFEFHISKKEQPNTGARQARERRKTDVRDDNDNSNKTSRNQVQHVVNKGEKQSANIARFGRTKDGQLYRIEPKTSGSHSQAGSDRSLRENARQTNLANKTTKTELDRDEKLSGDQNLGEELRRKNIKVVSPPDKKRKAITSIPSTKHSKNYISQFELKSLNSEIMDSRLRIRGTESSARDTVKNQQVIKSHTVNRDAGGEAQSDDESRSMSRKFSADVSSTSSSKGKRNKFRLREWELKSLDVEKVTSRLRNRDNSSCNSDRSLSHSLRSAPASESKVRERQNTGHDIEQSFNQQENTVKKSKANKKQKEQRGVMLLDIDYDSSLNNNSESSQAETVSEGQPRVSEEVQSHVGRRHRNLTRKRRNESTVSCKRIDVLSDSESSTDRMQETKHSHRKASEDRGKDSHVQRQTEKDTQAYKQAYKDLQSQTKIRTRSSDCLSQSSSVGESEEEMSPRKRRKLETISEKAAVTDSDTGSVRQGSQGSRKVKLYASKHSPQILGQSSGVKKTVEICSPQVSTVLPVKRSSGNTQQKEVVSPRITRHTAHDEESERIEQLRQSERPAQVYRDIVLAQSRDRHMVEQAERSETDKLLQLYEPTVPRRSPRLQRKEQVQGGRNSGMWRRIMEGLVTPTKKFMFGSGKE